MVAIFIVFIINEYLRKKEDEKEDFSTLKEVFRAVKQIEKDINYHTATLGANNIPLTEIGTCEAELPLYIKNKSTQKLNDSIYFANDKIITINTWREGVYNILLEPNNKKRDSEIKRYNDLWGENHKIAFEDLKNEIEKIKEELRKWMKIYD
ncbi:MAG: hypothetical protein OQK82_08985 [Candidatus Pacearchaeota archaeon]|nr:hypothetical protein [Candidatus Pacearchaeota archaeon]